MNSQKFRHIIISPDGRWAEVCTVRCTGVCVTFEASYTYAAKRMKKLRLYVWYYILQLDFTEQYARENWDLTNCACSHMHVTGVRTSSNCKYYEEEANPFRLWTCQKAAAAAVGIAKSECRY